MRDGWIKIPAEDFYVGLARAKSGRLLVGLNQLLLKIAGRIVLVDTGLGDKWTPSDVDLLDFQQPRLLLTDMQTVGVYPEDVDIVILTHLHFDHSGGCTRQSMVESLAPTFTNALYYVQLSELEFALQPGLDSLEDYRPESFEPLKNSGRLVEIDGDVELLPGLSLYQAPGHSPGHQIVVCRFSDNTLFFPGDLIATNEHANLEVSMSYDHDITQLNLQRRKWLQIASDERWTCVFCHAIKNPVGQIKFP